MDLFRYFKRKSRDEGLPDPTGPLSSRIPSRVIARANHLVQTTQGFGSEKTRGSYSR